MSRHRDRPASRRRTVRQPAPKPSTSASKLPPTSHVATSDPDPHTTKTLTTLKRRRKQRTQALRDIIDDTLPTHSRRRQRRRDGAGEGEREGEECPVCMRMVWGDPDVVHAHVDACLAHNSMVATMTIRDPSGSQSHSASTPELDVDVEEDADDNVGLGGPSTTDDLWEETITPEGHTGLRLRLGGVGSASRGAAQRLGFVVGSNRSEPLSRRGTGSVGDADGEIDLDVDVDVDGDDEGAFGTVQFGESDVIKLTAGRVGGQGGAGEEADVDVDGEGEVEVDAEGPEQKLTPQEQTEMELSRAKIAGDAQATIRALESLLQLRTLSHPNPTSTPSTTVSPSTATNQFTCRICLDAYTEPTVSIGCWHVCCRECWLRCLGSTKLCPICMRITGVGELRRVYI